MGVFYTVSGSTYDFADGRDDGKIRVLVLLELWASLCPGVALAWVRKLQPT